MVVLRTFREFLPEDLSLSPPEDLLSMTMWTFRCLAVGCLETGAPACSTSVLAAASALEERPQLSLMSSREYLSIVRTSREDLS